jgi:oxygen-independent coproporphyrinogen-3 oxidase
MTQIGPDTPEMALYVHIPFCETKCPYCDFNTYEGISNLIPDYVSALCKELSYWGSTLSRPAISTIFIGGGTPSLLSEQHLTTIIDNIFQQFSCSEVTEITIECNPGDLDYKKAVSLKRTGISRLSIGVQSLDDAILRVLGRRHTSEEAIQAYHAVRAAGFDRINLDFMYGIPLQTLSSWQQTLDQAVLLTPDHLSLYCLTIEPNTPMEAMTKRGQLQEPDPDLAADMYEYCLPVLSKHGYHHYEISNWAKPGHLSLHNLTYWKNGYYLGVGPGAHSHLSSKHIALPSSAELDVIAATGIKDQGKASYRFSVIRSPRDYIQKTSSLTDGGDPSGTKKTKRYLPATAPSPQATWFLSGLLDNLETIGPEMQMAETMMLGMRLSEGVNSELFEERFHQSLTETYPQIIAELLDLDLVKWQNNALTLTDQGMLFGNEVFMRFVAE